MRAGKKTIQRCMRSCLAFLLLAGTSMAMRPQAPPDFSGSWKQDNDRCQPKRSGDVTLRIEHRGSEISVETTMSRGSQTPRHAMQKYTTDGKVSISTGIDGDEFHTSAGWQDAHLVFSIEEHEEGRILRAQERWSLIEDGAALERIREHANGEKQVLIYRRMQLAPR